MFYPWGQGRQWSWKGGGKKLLPGRESFNCSFEREAGAAEARNESSVWGVSPSVSHGSSQTPLNREHGPCSSGFPGSTTQLGTRRAA